MNMTSVFVELVVIGVGAAAVVILIALSFLGWGWVPWGSLSSLPMAVPALSVIYVLGIAADRLADHVFHKPDHKLRHKFFDTGEAFHAAKNKVYDASSSRRDLQEYGKSRVRISRAWCLIWIVLALLIPLFLWLRCSGLGNVGRACVISSALCLLLAKACHFAWHSITVNNYKQIAKP